MRKLITNFAIGFVLVCFASAVSAQSNCPPMPVGTVCISQTAANQAAENARELAATKDKAATLEQALKDKDATIAENKDAAEKNVADLKKALHDTEISLATATGQLIKCEANDVSNRAIIQVLVQNYKARSRIGLIVF